MNTVTRTTHPKAPWNSILKHKATILCRTPTTTFTQRQHTPSSWRNVLSTCSAPCITKMTSYFCWCKYQTLSTVPTTNISPKSPCLLMAHYIHFSVRRCVSMTICGFWDTYTMFWLFINPSRWKMVYYRQSEVLRYCWMNHNKIWQKTHLCCFLPAVSHLYHLDFVRVQ